MSVKKLLLCILSLIPATIIIIATFIIVPGLKDNAQEKKEETEKDQILHVDEIPVEESREETVDTEPRYEKCQVLMDKTFLRYVEKTGEETTDWESTEEVRVYWQYAASEGQSGDIQEIAETESHEGSDAAVAPEEGTKEPEEAPAPETTQQPEETSAPEAMQQPEEAPAPEATQQPKETPAPEKQKEPSDGARTGMQESNTQVSGEIPAVEKGIYVSKGTILNIISEEVADYLVLYNGTEYLVSRKNVARVDAFDMSLYNKKVIVIDAGHQGRGNSEKEAIGPGATETKDKVAGGTHGATQKESELTLDIALMLQDELEDRGYIVLQVRETEDVNISNSERSEVANSVNADAFIRLHANGAENSGANGAQTICPKKSNPYPIAKKYEECKRLAICVLDAYVESTGCRKEDVFERDDMAGINWCEVPVTILEMGYMTNVEEDRKMQDPDYRKKMIKGIADGIDNYFAEPEDTKDDIENYVDE